MKGKNMSKHETQTVSVCEAIEYFENDTRMPSDTWYECFGFEYEIDGLVEAMDAGDYNKANDIESEWLKQHGNDNITVSWPDHVITPLYNGDASYELTDK